MEDKIKHLYEEKDYAYCLKCIRWAAALKSFRPCMLSVLVDIVLNSKSLDIREEGSSLLDFISSTSTSEDFEAYIPNLQSSLDEEEGEGYWSTFCKVINQSVEAPQNSSFKKTKKKKHQDAKKANANIVLRYYVSLMKKHSGVVDLLTGAGTVEHHEHFLTFLESLKKITPQDLDGSIYLGSVFEILALFITRFDCFITEFVSEMAEFLKEMPFVPQMHFLQYCPDEQWKLSLIDELFCTYAGRAFVPFAKGSRAWRACLKEPPSYGKFESCVLALKPSYVSRDLINWMSFVVTTYAKLLKEGADVPSLGLKDRAGEYVDEIFGWWKESNDDEDDEDDAAIPAASLVVLPLLPSLI